MRRVQRFLLAVPVSVALSLSPVLPSLAQDKQSQAPVRHASESETRAPKIEFAETSFDFGEIHQGEQVVHRFRFRNAGNADLHVGPIRADSVRAYCGLPDSIAAEPPSRSSAISVIPPGAWGEIVATFSSGGLGTGFQGQTVQVVHVYSNDLIRPRVVLQMGGRVKAVLISDPPVVVMGRVFKANGELPEYLPPVRLSPTPGHHFTITKVESNSPFLRPSAKSLPGGGYLLTTMVDPAIPEGELGEAKIVVHTTHPKKSTVIIPVAGEVQLERPVIATPPFIDAGLLKPGEERSVTVMVAKGSLTNWKLLAVKTESTSASVRVSSQRVGSAYEVKVSLRAPSRPLESFRATIRLITDGPHQSEVTIPVVGWTYADEPFSFPLDRLKSFVMHMLNEELLQWPQEVVKTVLVGGRDERALEVLLGVLHDDKEQNWRAQMQAAALLPELGNPKAFTGLEAAARSAREEFVREEAIEALFKIAPQRALPSLLHALRDDDEWVREVAASLLGKLADARAVPELLRAMHDNEEDVALAAADSLEKVLKGTAAAKD